MIFYPCFFCQNANPAHQSVDDPLHHVSTSLTLLNPYCTLRDAQAEAGNTNSDDARDLLHEINKASRWIDEHCHRDFLFHNHAATPLVVHESWCAGNVIYLPWPVITLTEVKVGGVVLASAEYRTSLRPGSATAKIERNGSWLPGPSSSLALTTESLAMAPLIELRGTFGFAPADTAPTSTPSPNLPATIVQACAAIAAIRSGLVKREVTGLSGQREAITVRSVPKAILESLGTYCIAVV